MIKTKLYHIFDTINKTSVYCNTYNVCLYLFNKNDKIYRKTHKIIPSKEYERIMRKKLTL